MLQLLQDYQYQFMGRDSGDGKDMKMEGPWWDMFTRVAADLRSDDDG
jgi:hypothetical protein